MAIVEEVVSREDDQEHHYKEHHGHCSVGLAALHSPDIGRKRSVSAGLSEETCVNVILLTVELPSM